MVHLLVVALLLTSYVDGASADDVIADAPAISTVYNATIRGGFTLYCITKNGGYKPAINAEIKIKDRTAGGAPESFYTNYKGRFPDMTIINSQGHNMALQWDGICQPQYLEQCPIVQEGCFHRRRHRKYWHALDLKYDYIRAALNGGSCTLTEVDKWSCSKNRD